MPKVNIHFSVWRDRYLLKPVPRLASSPSPALYFTERSQEMFLLPSKKKGKKKKGKKKEKRKKKKKSLVSTLTPTRRVLCLASALLFVIHLHGMMFALAGGAVAGSLARGRVLLLPSGARSRDAQPLVLGGFGVLGCGGCPRWQGFRVAARWWWEQRAQCRACKKEVILWSSIVLAGR